MTQELLALAERVEKAAGPDIDLNVAIYLALHTESGTALDYTASIDAAMTLVGYTNGRPHNLVTMSAYGRAYIVPNDGASYGVNDPSKGEAVGQGEDEIGRMARAITAAALRARAHQSEIDQ